jgi:hypothetical protein
LIFKNYAPAFFSFSSQLFCNDRIESLEYSNEQIQVYRMVIDGLKIADYRSIRSLLQRFYNPNFYQVILQDTYETLLNIKKEDSSSVISELLIDNLIICNQFIEMDLLFHFPVHFNQKAESHPKVQEGINILIENPESLDEALERFHIAANEK